MRGYDRGARDHGDQGASYALRTPYLFAPVKHRRSNIGRVVSQTLIPDTFVTLVPMRSSGLNMCLAQADVLLPEGHI
jgi:hypothetical protein